MKTQLSQKRLNTSYSFIFLSASSAQLRSSTSPAKLGSRQIQLSESLLRPESIDLELIWAPVCCPAFALQLGPFPERSLRPESIDFEALCVCVCRSGPVGLEILDSRIEILCFRGPGNRFSGSRGIKRQKYKKIQR